MVLRVLLMVGALACSSSARGQVVSDEERAEGFVPLFDGTSLAGWTEAVDSYAVEDGAITCTPGKGKGGNLVTEKDYGDFILRLEFKLTPGGNNGIGLRMPPKSHAATEGFEIQVLDDTAAKYAKLEPYQYHGSVYGIIPARRGFLKPVGEWNSQEIRLVGRRITIVLNGETIVDGDLDEASTPETLDHKDHPGLKRTTGRIGFLGHGSREQYRNIRIREVPPESNAAEGTTASP